MSTWYKTSRYASSKIEPVEVVRETPQMVVLLIKAYDGKKVERRQAKDGYDQFFQTWEQAHAHLMTKAEAAVLGARRNLEIANSTLGNVKGLKKPEGA